ncbi:TIP41-like family-domain-containing protein [Kockovaella imperatae]|uniref:TIP41-like family-domain-containing protein n=1 Tax=Kockovaella imperatae TaxID=4999 RepID=A0A1Y1U945_9TREE|nr:TIP41-like family-domain-containing protein [Kockovaella imperatae]ORX34026.1 TIP41-like family-domain-containing protein [Kockovaella imperatae]
MADAHPARLQTLPSMPRFTLKKDKYTNRIDVERWSITATKRPILNGKEIDSAEKRFGLPLPEMTFGNNSLVLIYDPTLPSSSSTSTTRSVNTRGSDDNAVSSAGGSSTNQRVVFDAMEALQGVAVGEGWEERVGGGVKVSMADKWSKSRRSPSLLSDTPVPEKPVRPHDWTYSTCYPGSSAPPTTSAFASSSSHSIPLELLARRDPSLDQILYYEDVPLFEDELHDHGGSMLNVRIRVMPHCLFILARLFVRVDNVLFRIHDVRVYHAFGSNEVIREVSGLEADYKEVKARLIKPEDLSPLTDQNWVSETMMSLAAKSVDEQGRPRLRSRITGKPWPGLGRRCEVLRLDSVERDIIQAGDKLSDLKVSQ